MSHKFYECRFSIWDKERKIRGKKKRKGNLKTNRIRITCRRLSSEKKRQNLIFISQPPPKDTVKFGHMEQIFNAGSPRKDGCAYSKENLHPHCTKQKTFAGETRARLHELSRCRMPIAGRRCISRFKFDF